MYPFRNIVDGRRVVLQKCPSKTLSGGWIPDGSVLMWIWKDFGKRFHGKIKQRDSVKIDSRKVF